VIAVDTNVLLYAHRAELPRHVEARERLVALAEGAAAWALPVFVIGEFLRVITHPRVFDPPHTIEEATEAVERLLASPSVHVLAPAERWPGLVAEAMREGKARGNLVFDAQIVAVCREHGVTALLTEDRDFDRFELPTMRLD
jgi:toxin-antitoxin system PIN domain toxin